MSLCVRGVCEEIHGNGQTSVYIYIYIYIYISMYA